MYVDAVALDWVLGLFNPSHYGGFRNRSLDDKMKRRMPKFEEHCKGRGKIKKLKKLKNIP